MHADAVARDAVAVHGQGPADGDDQAGRCQVALQVAGGVEGQARGDRKNVLVVTIDTLRADRLAPYGADNATPTISAPVGGELVLQIGTTKIVGVTSAGADVASGALTEGGLTLARRRTPYQAVGAGRALTQADEDKVLQFTSGTVTLAILAQGTTICLESDETGFAIDVGGTTLSWRDGSGTVKTGARTIKANSVVTIYWATTQGVRIFGNGIS